MRIQLVGANVYRDGSLHSSDVLIEDGWLVSAWESNTTPLQTIDCTGLTLLPGVIDSQVHFREPGLTHKEDLASGTAAAALGGVTAVFEMPNTTPSTTDEPTFLDKGHRAQDRVWSNIGFYLGASAENATCIDKLEQLPGCCGVKVFMGSSTGDLLVQEDDIIAQVLRHGHKRVAFHAEDNQRLQERAHIVKGEAVSVHDHPRWRDEETALRATQRLITLGHQVPERPMHVLHITTADEMVVLAEAKKSLPNLSVEVTPQHLTLSAPECYDRLGTLAQMNPPVRSKTHQEGLWKALNAGVVDVIGSDHAPHTLEEKAKVYPKSPSGMTGVQTLLPLMLNHVHEGRLSLQRLVQLVCERPVELFNLPKMGRVEPGYRANLTLVDLNAKRTITNQWIASKSRWTPFNGMAVTGWPMMTIVNGQVAMRDDELVGPPKGQLLFT